LISTREVNKFFSAIIPELISKTFFVTVPSCPLLEKLNSSTDEYRKRLFQSQQRDLNSLEMLQYDKRFFRTIGIHAFRRHILHSTWVSYHESVPRVLKQIKSRKGEIEKKIHSNEQQITNLDHKHLRGVSSDYAVKFLQTIERLIHGTSEGNPNVSGQTLDEEKKRIWRWRLG